MTRKWIDCRDFPDDTGCSLYLSGEADHVRPRRHAMSELECPTVRCEPGGEVGIRPRTHRGSQAA